VEMVVLGLQATQRLRISTGCRRPAKVPMLGLQNSGKTTILRKWMFADDLLMRVPTIGFDVEVVEYKDFCFTAWDVGGMDKIRPLWRHYYEGSDALAFVLDSSDRSCVGEVREELHRLLDESAFNGVPLLILANKQDMPDAMCSAEVAEELGLRDCLPDRLWRVQPLCAVDDRGVGLDEGLEWLTAAVASNGAGQPTSSLLRRQRSLDSVESNRKEWEVESGSCLLVSPSSWSKSLSGQMAKPRSLKFWSLH